MERPKNLKGEAAKYADYLEEQLGIFKSRRTKIRTYLSLKRIVDDINNLINRGLEIENPNSPGEIKHVPIISDSALTSKDEKTFERIFKVLDKHHEWTKQVTEMEEELTRGEIDIEKELMKGDASVEGFIFGRDNG